MLSAEQLHLLFDRFDFRGLDRVCVNDVAQTLWAGSMLLSSVQAESAEPSSTQSMHNLLEDASIDFHEFSRRIQLLCSPDDNRNCVESATQCDLTAHADVCASPTAVGSKEDALSLLQKKLDLVSGRFEKWKEHAHYVAECQLRSEDKILELEDKLGKIKELKDGAEEDLQLSNTTIQTLLNRLSEAEAQVLDFKQKFANIATKRSYFKDPDNDVSLEASTIPFDGTRLKRIHLARKIELSKLILQGLRHQQKVTEPTMTAPQTDETESVKVEEEIQLQTSSELEYWNQVKFVDSDEAQHETPQAAVNCISLLDEIQEATDIETSKVVDVEIRTEQLNPEKLIESLSIAVAEGEAIELVELLKKSQEYLATNEQIKSLGIFGIFECNSISESMTSTEICVQFLGNVFPEFGALIFASILNLIVSDLIDIRMISIPVQRQHSMKKLSKLQVIENFQLILATSTSIGIFTDDLDAVALSQPLINAQNVLVFFRKIMGALQRNQQLKLNSNNFGECDQTMKQHECAETKFEASNSTTRTEAATLQISYNAVHSSDYNQRQAQTIVMWINSLGLMRNDFNSHIVISNLVDDFRTGSVLQSIVKYLLRQSGMQCNLDSAASHFLNAPVSDPVNKFGRIQACEKVIEVLKLHKHFSSIKISGISGGDIEAGSEKMTLSLGWQLMKWHLMNHVRSSIDLLRCRGESDEEFLLKWATNQVTKARGTCLIQSSRDLRLKSLEFFFDLLYSIQPRIIDWDMLMDTDSAEGRISNARLLLTCARKLNAVVYLSPIDLIDAGVRGAEMDRVTNSLLASLFLVCPSEKD